MPRSLWALFAVALITFSMPARADTEDNKKTASRVLLEKMGKGDFSRLDEIYGPGFKAHAGDRTFTLEEDNASGKAIRSAAPDMVVAVERLIGDGDLVAVHWRATGTNSVAAAGMPGKGKRLSVQGMTFFRFDKGLIVEEWSITDQLSMMQQLGMM